MPTVRFGKNTADNFTGCDDASIRNTNPNNNYGQSTELTTQNFDALDLSKVLIEFTGLAALRKAVTTITNVSLNLYLISQDNGINGNRTIAWRRVLRSWVEGTEDNLAGDPSWNEYSAGNAWQTAGAGGALDRSSTISAQLTVGQTTGQYYSFTGSQLIADVQAYVDGTISELSWLGEDEGAIEEAWRVWASSQGTNGQRPYLEVTYSRIDRTFDPLRTYRPRPYAPGSIR